MEEIKSWKLWSWIGVSQIYIFESKVHSNVIIIWDIDSNWGSRASKRDDIEVGKIWFRELFLFKFSTPWKLINQLFSLCNKNSKLRRRLFVHDGHKALKLCSSSKWIKIGFNKTNIGLNDWAYILNPVFLWLFVDIYVTILEVFNICFAHVLLVFISTETWCFFHMTSYTCHNICEITRGHM